MVLSRNAHIASPRLYKNVHKQHRIVPNWEQPRCPSSLGQISIICCIHSKRNKYYSTMRRNKPQLHVTTRMNPPNIRQKPDTKVHTRHNSIYIKNKSWATFSEAGGGVGVGGPEADTEAPGWWPWSVSWSGCWWRVSVHMMKLYQAVHLRCMQFTVRVLYFKFWRMHGHFETSSK